MLFFTGCGYSTARIRQYRNDGPGCGFRAEIQLSQTHVRRDEVLVDAEISSPAVQVFEFS